MDEAIKYFKKTLKIDIESLSISELQEYSDKNLLNLKVNTTKAFVHNGKIIINASKADLSDLFHEISHIFMGVLKVKYPEAF